DRLAALLRGDFEATVLQGPWITLAEKAGCRLVFTPFFHRTGGAGPPVSPEGHEALVRAVTAAVRRIYAVQRRSEPYFRPDFPDHPGVQALTPADFNLGRIPLKEPGPIPEHEARWAWEWMASWGLLSGRFDPATQINREVEEKAHHLAAVPSY